MSSLVNTETGEITDSMSESDARRLTDRIQLIAEALADNLDKLADLIDQARTGSAWLALGYRSWTDYVSQEFTGVLPRLDREPRQEFVRELASRGMSSRAIAPVVGVSDRTAAYDVARVQSCTPDSPQAEEASHVELGVPDERGAEVEPPAAPRPAVVGIDGKTYTRPQPKAPKPVLDGEAAEYDNAEQSCKSLARAVSKLLEFEHPNMRAGMRRYWAMASAEVPPAPRADVNPEQMRAAAQGLLTLADEWNS